MKRVPKDTHIYFPQTTFDKLKAAAKEERRTISAQVVFAVEEWLARRPKGKAATK